ncbi:FUSC family protein [Cohnella pontilimi]|nr:FUSC family protein [Cohnella pontilimi]
MASGKHRPQWMKVSTVTLMMGIASALAWELAKLAGSKHPFLAPVSVILCTKSTFRKSLQFSYYRLLGTMLGVYVTAWAVRFMPLNGWSLGLLIVAVGFISLLFGRKEVLVRETALSVALVISLQKESGVYAFDRIRDTFIGVAVALIIQYVIYRPKKSEIAGS